MDALTITIAAVAGAISSFIASRMKSFLGKRRQSAEIDIVGPTGEHTKLSLERAKTVDPAEIKMSILRAMLSNPKFSFGRELETLCAAIGSDTEETRNLLLRLGARHNLKSGGRDTWTLQPEDRVL